MQLTARLAVLVLGFLLLLWLVGRHALTSDGQQHLPPGWRSDFGPRRWHCLVLDEAALSDASEGVSFVRLMSALSARAGAKLAVLQAGEPASRSARSVRASLSRAEAAAVRWIPLPMSRHVYEASRGAAVSFCIYEWAAAQEPSLSFDLMAFHGGSGYYSLLARGQALGLRRTRVLVLLPTTTQLRWAGGGGGSPAGARLVVSSLGELEEDHMERSSLAAADALLASPRALAFLRSRGWAVPPVAFAWVGLGLTPSSAQAGASAAAALAASLAAVAVAGAWAGVASVESRPAASGGGALASADDGAAALWDALRNTTTRAPRLIPEGESGERMPEGEAEREAHGTPADAAAHAAAGVAQHGTATGRRRRAGGGGVEWTRRGLGRGRSEARGAGVGGAFGGVRVLMPPPLVTVCVVHHERGRLLLQTLSSLRRQTINKSLLQARVKQPHPNNSPPPTYTSK